MMFVVTLEVNAIHLIILCRYKMLLQRIVTIGKIILTTSISIKIFNQISYFFKKLL